MRAVLLLVVVASGCAAFGAGDAATMRDAGAPSATPDSGTIDGAVDGDAATCGPAASMQADVANCGRCGHPCLGGACTAGICQPALVASFSGGHVVGVVADATHVAWLYRDASQNEPSLAVVPIDLSTAPVVTDFSSDPVSIVATSDMIFASGEGGNSAKIMRVTADGLTTPMATGSASGLHYPAALYATDALYILDYYDGDGDGIFSLPFDAETSTTPTLRGALKDQTLSGINWLDLLVVRNQAFIFAYASIGSSTIPTTDQPTSYCLGSNCAQGIVAFATDGTSLFWIDDQLGTLHKCPIAASCASSELITSSGTIPEKVRYLRYDGGQLFLGTDPGGSDGKAKIYACPPGDCTRPQTIVTEPALATRTFANATAIYWIADDGVLDGGSNHGYRVMRIAR